MLFTRKSSSSLTMMLEPRLMFDAAATATAEATVAADETTQASNETQTVEANQAPAITTDSTNLEYVGKADDVDWSSYSLILNSAEDLAVSADGNYAYAVSLNTSNYYETSSVLSLFSVDEDGTLTLVKSYYNYTSSGGVENEGLDGASIVRLSEDQKFLYVFGEDDNSLVFFSREESTGELTRLGSTDVSAFGIDGVADYVEDIQASNGYLYLVGADSVFVLSTQEDGSLSLLHSYSNETEGVEGLTGARRVTISEDGGSLFVGSSGDDSILTLFSIAEDGALTYVSSVEGAADAYYIQSVVVSSDGKTVYALNENAGASLLVMAFDDAGVLVLQDSYEVSAGARTLLLSDDGTGVFALGDDIDIFLQDGSSLTSVSTIDGNRFSNDFGVEISGIKRAYLSADGSKLFIVLNSSVQTFTLSTPAATYTENSEASVLLPTGRISDSELDDVDDYNGASYSVVRESGALAEDSFGFLAENGLTLEGDKILQDGNEIATFSVVNNALTVTFTTSVTQDTAQEVLRQITYTNTSADPVANGASPVFAITLDDGDGNQDTLNVTVNLVGVNNPAVIETTPLSTTYHTGDDYTPLFENTSIDTIEADQKVWKIQLTIDGASSDDVLKVGDSKISLSAFSGTKTSVGLTYGVSEVDGVYSVILYVMSPAEEAASIIDSITYKHNGDEVSGTRSITLGIVEYTEPLDVDTNTTTFTAANASITLAAAEQENLAPVIVSDVESVSYTENTAAVAIFPNTTISDVQMDGYNGAQGNYHGASLVVAISNASVSDVLVFEDGNGLSASGNNILKDGVVIASLSNEGGTLTVTFSEDNGTIPTTFDVQNVLHQIQYLNSGDAPAAQVDVTLTLTDQMGVSASLERPINVTQVNDAPMIVDDPLLSVGDITLVTRESDIEGLMDVAASTVSSDGRLLYVADSSGNIAIFSRDPDSGELTYQATLAAVEGISSISQLVTTSDGQSLYALANGGDALLLLSLDGNNELSVTQTIVNGADNNRTVDNVKELALSADGKNVYFINLYGLVAMDRDSDTGQLTYVEYISSTSEPYLWQPSSLTVTDDHVFVTTNRSTSVLIALQRTDSGLSWTAYLRNGYPDTLDQTVALTSPSHIAATADGTFLYVVSDNDLQIFSYDVDSKLLTVVGSEELNIDSVTDITLSDEKNQLYISASDGSLTRYLIGEDGALLLIDSTQQAAAAGDSELLVLDDGSVFVQGSDIAMFNVASVEVEKYVIGAGAVVMFPTLGVSDAEFDDKDNYSGLSLGVISRDGNVNDSFGLSENSDFSVDGSRLLYLGNEVGSLVQDRGQMVITITGDLTQAQVNSLIRSLTFENSTLTQDAALDFILFANDGVENSELITVSVDSIDNDAPVLAGDYVLPSTVVGEVLTLTFPEGLVSDADGDELTWSLSGLPSGFVFDPLTRTLSGIAQSAGEFSLLLTVSDVFDKSVQLELSLVVEEPVIVPPPIADAPVVDEPIAEPPVADVPVIETPTTVVSQPVFTPDTTPDNRVSRDNNSFTSRQTNNANSASAAQTTPLASTNAITPTESPSSQTTSSSFGVADNVSQGAATSTSSFSTLPVEPFVEVTLTFSETADSVQYSLADNVLSIEEKQIESVSMANGSALPEGVSLDLNTMQLNVSKGALKAGEALELQLLVIDEDGNQSLVPVVLGVQGDEAAELQDQAADASETDKSEVQGAPTVNTGAPALTQQVQQASQLSVAENSRILLSELSVN